MIAPMLAKSKDSLPSSEDFIFEIKLDGQRTIAEITNHSLLLYTRNFQNVTDKYPELEKFGSYLKAKKAILDGEIVALQDGIPSFELLQQRMNLRNSRALATAVEQIPVIYYAFDILQIDSRSLLKTPLLERKKILSRALKTSETIKILPYFDSRDFTIDKAIQFGYEGVVAKKKSSPYYPGQRTDCWLKQKFQQYTSLVICGWTEGGRSKSFGSLLVGQYQGDDLLYAGRVGTGFTESTIVNLMEEFRELISKSSPFKKAIPVGGKVHWLKPELLVKVKFKEWTKAHVLRAPVFMGWRRW
jgi:bifunctional non-homologous end joining protein LigD